MPEKKEKADWKDFCVCLGIMAAVQFSALIPPTLLLWGASFITPFTVAGVLAFLLVADVFIIGLAVTSARSQAEQEDGDGEC